MRPQQEKSANLNPAPWNRKAHWWQNPFEWLQKTWASSSTMENFQETLRGLPWSERRTWQRRHRKVIYKYIYIYVIWEFSEFGLKHVPFFKSFTHTLHHLIIRKNNVHLVARTHRLLIRMASWKSLANFPKVHTPLFHPLLLYSCKLARISTIHQETKAGKPLEDLITPMLQGAHWCYHKVWASRGEQVVEMLPTLTNCIENSTRFEVQELLHLEKLIWNKSNCNCRAIFWRLRANVTWCHLSSCHILPTVLVSTVRLSCGPWSHDQKLSDLLVVDLPSHYKQLLVRVLHSPPSSCERREQCWFCPQSVVFLLLHDGDWHSLEWHLDNLGCDSYLLCCLQSNHWWPLAVECPGV